MTPQDVQRRPKMYKDAPRCTKTPQGVQRCPKVYKDAPRCTKTPQGVQRCPKVYKDAPRCTKTPQGVQRCPKVYKDAPRCTKTTHTVTHLSSRASKPLQMNLYAEKSNSYRTVESMPFKNLCKYFPAQLAPTIIVSAFHTLCDVRCVWMCVYVCACVMCVVCTTAYLHNDGEQCDCLLNKPGVKGQEDVHQVRQGVRF